MNIIITNVTEQVKEVKLSVEILQQFQHEKQKKAARLMFRF